MTGRDLRDTADERGDLAKQLGDLQAGYASVETGLTRAKNVAHTTPDPGVATLFLNPGSTLSGKSGKKAATSVVVVVYPAARVLLKSPSAGASNRSLKVPSHRDRLPSGVRGPDSRLSSRGPTSPISSRWSASRVRDASSG
jgi:hypothetical protein